MLVGAAAHHPQPAHDRRPATVDAMVNDMPLALPRSSNVGEALVGARRLPRDGVLYSAVTHSPIDRHPGHVLLDNRPARLDQRLQSGDRIRVIDGTDAVEPIVEREVAIPSPGGALPDVEREVMSPGTDGMMRETVGAQSGEVLRQEMMRAPAPASKASGPVVALTFDDGPDPTFTPQVLQILANTGIKATFCVIGRDVRRFPEVLRAVAQQGHTICNHTDSHPRLDRLSPGQVEAQLAPVNQLIRDTVGAAPTFVRAPWGIVNGDTVAVAHKLGLRVLGWSVDPSDYLRSPADRLVARVVGAVKPGSIVIMHDGGEGEDRSQTVAALPIIIQQLRAQGYSFVVPPSSPAAVG